MPIVWNNRTYSTKTAFTAAVKAYRQEVKKRHVNKLIEPNTPDFELVDQLFKYHPKYEFITQGYPVGAYAIYTNAVGNGLEFAVCCAGNTVSFSYKAACEGAFDSPESIQKRTQRTNVLAAMRTAIEPQIAACRMREKQACKLCGTEDSGVAYEVDHDTPQFSELSRDFLKTNSPPDKFTKLPGSNYVKFVDTNFEQRWTEYHQKHATLRILCRDCNQRPRN